MRDKEEAEKWECDLLRAYRSHGSRGSLPEYDLMSEIKEENRSLPAMAIKHTL